MARKRPFSEIMREFSEANADDLAYLTPELIAIQTGYSLSTVKAYLEQERMNRHYLEEQQRQLMLEQTVHEQEADAITYVTSTGLTRLIYYPVLGEIKIESMHPKSLDMVDQPENPCTVAYLHPQDVIEIGIYLLGLQPHVRETLARRQTPKTEAEEVARKLPLSYHRWWRRKGQR